MPASGMGVSDAVFCLVGDTNSLQVLFDHEPSLLALEVRERLRPGGQSFEPLSKRGDQVGVQPLVLRARAARFAQESGDDFVPIVTPYALLIELVDHEPP